MSPWQGLHYLASRLLERARLLNSARLHTCATTAIAWHMTGTGARPAAVDEVSPVCSWRRCWTRIGRMAVAGESPMQSRVVLLDPAIITALTTVVDRLAAVLERLRTGGGGGPGSANIFQAKAYENAATGQTPTLAPCSPGSAGINSPIGCLGEQRPRCGCVAVAGESPRQSRAGLSFQPLTPRWRQRWPA